LIKKFPSVWEKCQKTAGGIFGLTLYTLHGDVARRLWRHGFICIARWLQHVRCCRVFAVDEIWHYVMHVQHRVHATTTCIYRAVDGAISYWNTRVYPAMTTDSVL